ncbi:MAG: hypothetical protein DCC71_24295, partial [Proteobacteria bacterium]
LAAAARGSGLLAVAPGVERAQLATRRPLVLDPQAIDMVAYVPAALPAVAAAIEGLYGVDFASPRAEDRNRSVVPVATVRAVWERRSAPEWEDAARRFGFADVLAPASWRLALPELARTPAFVLYRAPTP